jgi:uncharacterized caspase-like protein
MKALWLVPVLVGVLCQPAFSSADGCRGALNALNRVKEQIRPDLTDQDQLKTMLVTLQAAWRNCDDEPEILHYRSMIAEQLKDQKEVAYAQKQLASFRYKPAYAGSPFTPPPTAAPLSKVRQKWAIVVGINEFNDASIPRLRYAVQDSSEFAKYLKDPKGGRFRADHVTTLTNESATLDKFRTALGALRASAQPDDLVVIYISSHGSPRTADPNGVSYILMRDTDLTDAARLYATSLQMIDLVEQINREIRARRVVLFLDTCYSGDASNAGREGDGSRRVMPVWVEKQEPSAAETTASSGFSAALQNLKIGEGRAVITASRANEESWEDAKLKHGYFTYYLIDALREKDGSLPLSDVFPKVKAKVSEVVPREHAGKTQTPSAEFSDRASTIVVGVPETN